MVGSPSCYSQVNAETGTEVIEIRTVEDLYAINGNMSGNYKLMNDIDLSEATAVGGDYDFFGNGWKPIGSDNLYSDVAFTGVFDGNGFTIKGLNINVKTVPSASGEFLYLGLFANNSGTIKDLTVEGGIKTDELNKGLYCGAVAAKNSGDIINCKAKGVIDAKNCYTTYHRATSEYDRSYYTYQLRAGGISGYSEGMISQCSNEMTIEIFSRQKENTTISTRWSIYAGGIVGLSTNGFVYESYNLGRINSTYSTRDTVSSSTVRTGIAGGIMGYCNGATVYNCYNCGETNGAGIVCSLNANNTSNIKNCYNIAQVSSYAIAEKCIMESYYLSGTGVMAANAVELTEKQMRNQIMFVGFDFDDIWIIDDSTEYKYPQLRNNRQVTEKEIDTIEWQSVPTNLIYYTNSKINPEGGIITVYYMDGTSENISVSEEMLSGFDMAEIGVQTVTLTYRGKVLDYQIQVNQRPNIVSVSQVSGPDKTEFVRGTKFDFTGWKLQVLYDNATSEEIDVTADMTIGGNIEASGTYDIVCTYGGKTFTTTVKVIPVKLSGIEIVKQPTKLSYVEGQELNIEGMVVEAKYNNGTSKNISDYELSGYSSEIGTHRVTVTYNGFEASFDVTVEEGKAIALSIDKLPNKTQYIDGQTFDKTGLVVKAVYSDGYSKVISNYSLSEILPGIGYQNITVAYQDVSAYFTINVLQKQLQYIEVTHLPNKMTYIETEKFISDGLIISGVYNDGSKSAIENFTLTGNDTNTIGEKTVTAIYSGKSTSFSITVVSAELESLDVTEPNKKTYVIGEQLDLSGMVVRAVYNNGRIEEISDYDISGYTGESGTNIITVSYNNKDWTFAVVVHEPYGEWIVTKPATCIEKGEKIKYCRECGEIVLKEEIPALGHKEVTDPYKAPTCTEHGHTEGKHCSVCNEVLVAQKELEPLGHSPSEKWEIINHASCTKSGIQVIKCSVCGEVLEAKDVDPLGHIVETDKGKNPTCTQSGLTDGSHCSVCGEILVAQHAIDPTGHTASGIWIIDKKPTCTMRGSRVQKCIDCGEVVYTEKIEPLGHSFGEYLSNNDATCTSDGTKSATCIHCGETDTVTDIGTKLEHEYVMNVKKEATTSEEGYEIYKCKNCSDSYTVVIPKKENQTKETEKPTNGDNTKPSAEQTVNKKTAKIKNIKAKKKKLVISWKKVSGIKGYKIQYSLRKDFKTVKTKVVKKSATTSLTIKKLKSKKKYYVRICTYIVVNGKTYQSAWSKVKTKKTK